MATILPAESGSDTLNAAYYRVPFLDRVSTSEWVGRDLQLSCSSMSVIIIFSPMPARWVLLVDSEERLREMQLFHP